jgi:fucose permease
MVGVNVGWVGPFLPEISRVVQVPVDRAGLIVSASATGYFAALIIAGEVSSRWSARTILIAAMVLFAAGLFGLATAPILSAMLSAAFLIGLGNGAIDVAANALIVDLNRDRLAAALNYLHVLFGVGALMGPVIVGFALTNRVPYSLVFGAGALVCATVAIALVVTPSVEVRVPMLSGDGFMSMFTRPLIWVIGGVLFLYVGAETGIGAWLFLYLRSASALSETIASWGVSMYWLGLILGRMVGGRLAHLIAPRPFTMLAATLSALALVILIAAPMSHTLAAAMVVLIGFGYGPIFPNMIAVGATRFPADVGRMTSIVIAGGALGAIFVPWIMGRAMVVATPRASMEFALVVTAMMAILSVVGLRGVASPVESSPN